MGWLPGIHLNTSGKTCCGSCWLCCWCILVVLMVVVCFSLPLCAVVVGRSISSILGWVLVCVGIHEENQNGRRLLVHCSSLRTDLEKQKLRLQNMSGKHLDSASPHELEDLVLIQRAAVKSTERAIEFYRKRTEARGGNSNGRGTPSKHRFGPGSTGSPSHAGSPSSKV